MSRINPRVRAEREALPDPTGLGEAIGHRRDARRARVLGVELDYYAPVAVPEIDRDMAKRRALALEELYGNIEITLVRGPPAGDDWLSRRLDEALREALIQAMPDTQRVIAT